MLLAAVKRLCLILLAASIAFGQGVTIAGKVSAVGKITVSPPASSGGNPAFVNAQNGANYINTAPGTAATAAQNVTVGNALVVGCGGVSTDTVTVSDTAGDTFTADQSETVTADGKTIWVFHVASSAGNSSNITTCHFSSATGTVAVVTAQISNPGAIDAKAVGSNTGTAVSPVTTATYGTARANEVAVCFVHSTLGGGTNTFTAGSGYTIPANGAAAYTAGDYFDAVEYQTFSSTQSGDTCSFSWSGGSGYAAAALETF